MTRWRRDPHVHHQLSRVFLLGLALLISTALLADDDRRLVEAAKRQDGAALRTLLAERVDVNVAQSDGATALHWAIHWNDLAAVDLLIRAGANVQAANDYGVTPLTLACGNGNPAAVTRLLEAGADPDTALPSGETPLMTAARTGFLDAVKALIAAGANVNAVESAQHQSALILAISERHPDIARVLLDHGADARARSTRGLTPLLLAARQGDLDSARLLLAAGADVNEAASDLLSPLVVATIRDHAPLAIFLLEHGANPDADASGFTALHWAAGVWETELTGPLGIDIDRDEEWRALRGMRAGKLELVEALLSHGGNPNARIVKAPQRVGFTRGGLNLVGATPLLVAAAGGDAPLMRMLAANGSDPQLSTKEKTTVLMAAAGVGRVLSESSVTANRALEAVKVALELGGAVNGANDAGETALHGAAANQADAVVQFLVEHGASLNARNKRGQTPLVSARGSRTADLLKRLGADVESGDAKQKP